MAWDTGLEHNSLAYQIASAPSPRVRVVAGPGTGKSFAMKRRVARLLEAGVQPQQILPVTFTRVAAEDLHRELVGMAVQGCENLEGTTLHSLALRILMRQNVLAATGRQPRPLNDFEIGPLEADIAAAHGGKREMRRRLKAFEAAWARLQTDEPGFVQSQEDVDFQADLLRWMLFHRAMLIGEVIPQLYQYLRSNPLAPERTEFLHILVDEFQDLNRAEQGIIGLLSDNAHVCIVGDDDQSIYSFKHANPQGIQNWLVANPGAEDLTLVDCRRCPTRVVALANSLIANNVDRPVPRILTPIAANGEGDVRVIQYDSVDNEIQGVVGIIANLIAQGVPPGDILVLAQRRVIGNPIYEGLIAQEIHAKSYYAESELSSEMAQERFSYLKLLADETDRVALRWLLGHGNATWRAAGYRRVRAYSEDAGLSPWDVIAQLEIGAIAIPYTSDLVTRFVQVRAEVGRLGELHQGAGMQGIVNDLFPEGDNRFRDIRELSLQIIEDIPEIPVAEFLGELVGRIAKPEIPSEIEDVRIMSLHKSKGLSAPVTIIAGCIEGLLPKQPDANLPQNEILAQIEEQRRLFFVGITRVKANPMQGQPGTLILTSSTSMSQAMAMGSGIAAHIAYGVAHLQTSRFIQELGPEAPAAIAG